jgi:hypothetical protein
VSFSEHLKSLREHVILFFKNIIQERLAHGYFRERSSHGMSNGMHSRSSRVGHITFVMLHFLHICVKQGTHCVTRFLHNAPQGSHRWCVSAGADAVSRSGSADAGVWIRVYQS